MDVDEAYIKHSQYVRNVCYSIVKNWDDADDLTQDVFVTVIKKHEPINSKTARTWLYAIARNECKYFLLKRRPMINIDALAETPIDHLHHLDARGTVRTATAGFITNICQKLTTQFA